MYGRLVASVVAAVLLAASGWKLYSDGRSSGRAEVRRLWEDESKKRSEQALEAEKAARESEALLLAAKQKVENSYVIEKRKAARAAAGAESELGRLRDALKSRATSTCANPSAQSGADGADRLEQELLGECGGALKEMAGEAQRIMIIGAGLQDYVKNVCLSAQPKMAD